METAFKMYDNKLSVSGMCVYTHTRTHAHRHTHTYI